MKNYARVFRYIRQYKSEAFLYILFIILSIVFSLISLGMLFPFLEMIFNADGPGTAKLTSSTENPAVAFIRNTLRNSIDTRGKTDTLLLICILIVISVFFKNLFLYLAYYVLNPLKNKIVNRLRNELYDKMLHLPIGYFTEKKNKQSLLVHLLQDKSIETVLVFTQMKHAADKLAYKLNTAGIRTEAIHGDKSQHSRQRALENFKSRKTRVLVATDIAARGIDIEELTHVINFDLPNVPETYVHRIGRTGRAGAAGIAISFCDQGEKPLLNDIQKLNQRTIPVVSGHPFDMGSVHSNINKAPSASHVNSFKNAGTGRDRKLFRQKTY